MTNIPHTARIRFVDDLEFVERNDDSLCHVTE